VADCNIGPAVCATRLRADDRLALRRGRLRLRADDRSRFGPPAPRSGCGEVSPERA